MKTQMLKPLLLGSLFSIVILGCNHTSGANASATTADTMHPVKHDTTSSATRSSATSVRHDTALTSRDSMHPLRTDTVTRK